MKRIISTIVIMMCISSILASSVYAGERNSHGSGINPLWIPVAILSTIAAVVTIAEPQPVVYEHREYAEPRQVIVYEEPRHHHEHYYERNREAEMSRHHDYR